jgi:hypothetical protein
VLSRNEIVVRAPPERVFSVLAEPRSWVVGSRLLSPLATRGAPHVLESEPPRRLVLLAELHVVGALRVVLELEDDPGGGTRVVMDESPATGVVALARNPLSDRLLAARNVLSLRRLKQLAEA